MRSVLRLLLPCAIAGLGPMPSNAAVEDVGPYGFAVQYEVQVQAAPARLYELMVGHLPAWWDPQHTYSGDAGNLSLAPAVGGCLCEKLPGGGGVEHARIVLLVPGKALRLSGALGPLQAHGLSGSLTWSVAPMAGGTRMRLSYRVGGAMPGGFERVAPAVDGVLGEQMERLKRYAETGKADGPQPPTPGS